MNAYQQFLDGSMRVTLVDWMQEFANEVLLKRATFHLAVFYVDLYLTREPNLQAKWFQLLGATALFTASKFEEINPPRLKEIIYTTDNAFSRQQIVRMEFQMLKVFNFRISH